VSDKADGGDDGRGDGWAPPARIWPPSPTCGPPTAGAAGSAPTHWWDLVPVVLVVLPVFAVVLVAVFAAVLIAALIAEIPRKARGPLRRWQRRKKERRVGVEWP